VLKPGEIAMIDGDGVGIDVVAAERADVEV
jgi:hypothetical protein